MQLHPQASDAGGMAPLAPGPLVTIGNERLLVEIAPQAGGRIAQIMCDGVEQLVGPHDGSQAMNLWGCFPMVPWAGRLRKGTFDFEGRRYGLPVNLGDHALHGVGFALPWQVEACSPCHAELSLALPEDGRWPFGGACRQRIEVDGRCLRMTLTVTAGARAMPAVIGWHPWLRKPEQADFLPEGMYLRDREGISVPPLVPSMPGPWDDSFVNRNPVTLHRGGQRLQLTSDCDCWVVYDEPVHASCIEPQTDLPDAFNLQPRILAPGESLAAWFSWEWEETPGG